VTTLTASRRRAGYRHQFTLSGRATANTACGGPLRVALFKGDRSRPGAARRLVGSVPVGANGAWSHRVRARESANYFAHVQPTRSCLGSLSASVPVEVYGRVTAAVTCGRAARIRGRVLPGGAGTKVKLERIAGGRRRVLGTRRLGRSSRFSFRLPACSGRYRVSWPGKAGQNLPAATTLAVIRGVR
jgi:hypothetical protein